jgi:hypothetical protein
MPSRETRGQPTSLRRSYRCAFEALCGLGWCNNTLNLAQMVGAKQLGYLRAWLRRKRPSCDLGRLHEAIAQWNRRPANLSFDRRSASYNRWPRRCDGFGACSIASACKRAQRLDRRTPSCKRSAAQADANAAARARSVRSDSTKVVVPLVQDELRAWPARRAMLIRAARLCTDAVRVAIRPSTVHAEVQTLLQQHALADSAALVKFACAKPFEARRPSRCRALAHRNVAC